MRPQRRHPERHVEDAADQLCADAGCDITRLSQARATQQTPGVPDRRYYPREGLAFWFEAKTPEGRQTTDQAAFEARCRRCGDPYVLGGYREVLEYLIAHGHWKLPPGIRLEDVARCEPYRRRRRCRPRAGRAIAGRPADSPSARPAATRTTAPHTTGAGPATTRTP